LSHLHVTIIQDDIHFLNEYAELKFCSFLAASKANQILFLMQLVV